MSMKNGQFILVIIIVALFSSCKTTSIATSSAPNVSSKMLKKHELLQLIKQNSFEFNTLMAAKFNADITLANEKKSFKGSLRIQKDSIIYITISPALGIEIFRMKITPDSIMVIDRYNKQYFTGKFDFIEKKWGVEADFKTLQALLTNRIFSYPLKRAVEKEIKNFKFIQNGEQYVLKCSPKEEVSTTFTINNLGELLKSVMMDQSNQVAMTFNYSNFQQETLGVYPIQYHVAIENKHKKSELNINLRKVVFNTEIKTPFNVPSQYTPMKIEN